MSIAHDLRYAARTIRTHPAFSVPAICALALGIAANTSTFSVVDAVILRPLPFPRSERLVDLWERNSKANMPREFVTPGNYTDWRSQSTVFSDLAAWQQTTFNLLSTSDQPERFIGAVCDPAFFTALQVPPLLGRVFNESENQPGRDAVLLLSHALWLSRFGADTHVIGRQLRLDGRLRTVIGVMPQNFDYPSQANMWAPLALTNDVKTRRDLHQLRVIARLQDGVTLARAQAQMTAIEMHLGAEYPALDRDLAVSVNLMLEDAVRQIRPALLLLVAAVLFVLLIACANVANLLLAETYSAGREIALRVSLGASKRAMAQQILIESLLLAAISSALGLALAYLAIYALRLLAPAQLPRLDSIHIDWRALLFTILAALSTGLLFGFAPAWHASRIDLNVALKESSRGGTSRSPLRHALVILQVAVALVLLTGAGLLLRSFSELLRIEPGFNPDGVITLRLLPAQAKYRGNNDLQIALARGILREVSQLPGIQSVAITTDVPLIDDSVFIMRFADHPNVLPSQAPLAHTAAVTPEFFETMRIRLLKGRSFRDQDSGHSAPVAIISRQLAERYFPNADPLGKQLEVVFRTPPEWRQIVGVVDDIRSQGLDQESPVQVYTPYLQRPAMLRSFAPPLTVLARTASDPGAIAQSIKSAILKVDSSQPVYAVQPMTGIVSQSVAQRRLLLLLLTSFAAAALVLAVFGLYAVLAYAITQRTREFGIRMALGAQASQLIVSVQWEGLKLVLSGLAIGVCGSLFLTRLMSSVLFRTSPGDPLTYVSVAFLLIFAGAAACFIPARRAARVDAAYALRRD